MGFLFSLLSYHQLHRLGRAGGIVAFYLHKNFRKKTLTNLAIAYGLHFTEEKRLVIAKKSFQSLMITCLDYFRLKRSKGNLKEIVEFQGGEEVIALMKKGQGVIFLSGHQANWEIPFIAATEKFPGIAIGRPINNPWLYRWILSIREMNGGTIVMPRQAIKQGLKALKEGKFVGIVGDQAFPESSYSYPLFGTRAWTTNAPALLACRSNSPIVVVTTERKGDRYIVTGSPPLWPDLSKARDEQATHLMDEALSYLEKSIQKHPEQWMWQHDRWKQQGIDHVKKQFRFGFILIVLPPDPTPFIRLIPLFKKIYPRSFLTFFAPEGTTLPLEKSEIRFYKKTEDLFIRDWRYQLLIDFLDDKKLREHFLQLGAFEALHVSQMKNKAPLATTLEQLIIQTLVKPECQKTDFSSMNL